MYCHFEIFQIFFDIWVDVTAKKYPYLFPVMIMLKNLAKKNTATKTGAISGDNDSNLMQVEEHQRRGGKEEKLSIQFHLPTMRVNLVCFNNWENRHSTCLLSRLLIET